MPTQQDALVSAEGSAKVALSAGLKDLVAQGHVLDIEVEIAMASGAYQGLAATTVAQILKQVLGQLADKLVAPPVAGA